MKDEKHPYNNRREFKFKVKVFLAALQVPGTDVYE